MGQLAQKGVNFQIDKEICYLLINGKFITKGLYEEALSLLKEGLLLLSKKSTPIQVLLRKIYGTTEWVI